MTSRCSAHFSKSVLLTTLGSVEMVASLYDLEFKSISTDGCVKHRDRSLEPDLCINIII